eukprot:m.464208 g.464208  ORF g.464208 m.464208 type:complete len:73 (-) comp20356_c2_seq3:2258-2476(-)
MPFFGAVCVRALVLLLLLSLLLFLLLFLSIKEHPGNTRLIRFTCPTVFPDSQSQQHIGSPSAKGQGSSHHGG